MPAALSAAATVGLVPSTEDSTAVSDEARNALRNFSVSGSSPSSNPMDSKTRIIVIENTASQNEIVSTEEKSSAKSSAPYSPSRVISISIVFAWTRSSALAITVTMRMAMKKPPFTRRW